MGIIENIVFSEFVFLCGHNSFISIKRNLNNVKNKRAYTDQNQGWQTGGQA